MLDYDLQWKFHIHNQKPRNRQFQIPSRIEPKRRKTEVIGTTLCWGFGLQFMWRQTWVHTSFHSQCRGVEGSLELARNKVISVPRQDQGYKAQIPFLDHVFLLALADWLSRWASFWCNMAPSQWGWKRDESAAKSLSQFITITVYNDERFQLQKTVEMIKKTRHAKHGTSSTVFTCNHQKIQEGHRPWCWIVND